MISAQELTRTRNCAAQGCELDAEPSRDLCWRCLRKPTIQLHETPEVYTGPTLHCPGCGEFKPDEQFNRYAKNAHRRGRHSECSACCSARKRIERINWTDEQRERDRARHRKPA